MSSPRLNALEVLQTEQTGLGAIIEALQSDETPLAMAVTASVEAIQKATGRTIVTGMGKSGHVARKIAATLASTGTPAQNDHPAGASHAAKSPKTDLMGLQEPKPA